MKNWIFKDLLADTRIPTTIWKYVTISVVFHILMLYVLFSVRFDPPDMNRTIKVRQDAHPVVSTGGSAVEGASAPQTVYVYPHRMRRNPLHYNMDQYVRMYVKPFVDAQKQPVSRLPVQPLLASARRNSSFQKVKRSIQRKQLPPKELVKIEELVNYFNYQYPLPEDPQPFSITTELAPCPWTPDHLLLHIGLKGSIRDRDIKAGKQVIAEDLKLIVIFNSQKIKAYRLIGYSKQKPKLGQSSDRWPKGKKLYIGQSFTSLYELIPVETPDVADPGSLTGSTEIPAETAVVTVRYREPGAAEVKQVTADVYPIEEDEEKPSESFRFSAVVAQFGLFLQNPEMKEVSAIITLLEAARDALGEDKNGYRAEFIKMLQDYKELLEKKPK